MEKIAISESPLMKTEISSTNDVTMMEEGCDSKKIELNVNAKEFVPLQSADDSPSESATGRKNLVNGRNGESRPVFMNGMTEQFIQGPLMSNGRDPEIPYVRYFSNGQSIDFFNKKYFVNGPSGDILFRPDGTTEENKDYQKPLLLENNGHSDNNIFRPPFINAMVEDILHRQYLLAFGGKSLNCFMPMERRRANNKSSPQNSFQRYFPPKDLHRDFLQRNDKFSKDCTTPIVSPELWTADECAYGETQKNDSTSDDSNADPTINSPNYSLDDPETCGYKLPKYSEVDLYHGDESLHENGEPYSSPFSQPNSEKESKDITIQRDINMEISDMDISQKDPGIVENGICSNSQQTQKDPPKIGPPLRKTETDDLVVGNLCHSTPPK